MSATEWQLQVHNADQWDTIGTFPTAHHAAEAMRSVVTAEGKHTRVVAIVTTITHHVVADSARMRQRTTPTTKEGQ